MDIASYHQLSAQKFDVVHTFLKTFLNPWSRASVCCLRKRLRTPGPRAFCGWSVESPIATSTVLTYGTPNAFPLISSVTELLIITYINFSLQRVKCSCFIDRISCTLTILYTLSIFIVTFDSNVTIPRTCPLFRPKISVRAVF